MSRLCVFLIGYSYLYLDILQTLKKVSCLRKVTLVCSRTCVSIIHQDGNTMKQFCHISQFTALIQLCVQRILCLKSLGINLLRNKLGILFQSTLNEKRSFGQECLSNVRKNNYRLRQTKVPPPEAGKEIRWEKQNVDKKKPSPVYKRGCSVFTAVKVSAVDQGSSTVVFP